MESFKNSKMMDVKQFKSKFARKSMEGYKHNFRSSPADVPQPYLVNDAQKRMKSAREGMVHYSYSNVLNSARDLQAREMEPYEMCLLRNH